MFVKCLQTVDAGRQIIGDLSRSRINTLLPSIAWNRLLPWAKVDAMGLGPFVWHWPLCLTHYILSSLAYFCLTTATGDLPCHVDYPSVGDCPIVDPMDTANHAKM